MVVHRLKVFQVAPQGLYLVKKPVVHLLFLQTFLEHFLWRPEMMILGVDRRREGTLEQAGDVGQSVVPRGL